jgi:hypothetical protein
MPGMDCVIKQLEETEADHAPNEAVDGVDKCPPMNWVVDEKQVIL